MHSMRHFITKVSYKTLILLTLTKWTTTTQIWNSSLS